MQDFYRGRPRRRGEGPADRAALAECLQRVSQMVTGLPEARELGMNPVAAMGRGKGCLVLDVRIGLGPAA